MKPALFIVLATALIACQPGNAAPPAKGQAARDFTATAVDGKSVRLSELHADANVVLVMLRGWPGYQCPLCSRQVASFIRETEEFRKLNARLLLVYPGPERDLGEHAREFVGRVRAKWPEGFTLVTDPDYRITKL